MQITKPALLRTTALWRHAINTSSIMPCHSQAVRCEMVTNTWWHPSGKLNQALHDPNTTYHCFSTATSCIYATSYCRLLTSHTQSVGWVLSLPITYIYKSRLHTLKQKSDSQRQSRPPPVLLSSWADSIWDAWILGCLSVMAQSLRLQETHSNNTKMHTGELPSSENTDLGCSNLRNP